jgi:hypothetical protein
MLRSGNAVSILRKQAGGSRVVAHDESILALAK